jgi:hypothetical protein
VKTPLRFFGLVLLLLPATFTAWYALAGVFAAPGVWIVAEVLPVWLPGLVEEVYLDGAAMGRRRPWLSLRHAHSHLLGAVLCRTPLRNTAPRQP